MIGYVGNVPAFDLEFDELGVLSTRKSAFVLKTRWYPAAEIRGRRGDSIWQARGNFASAALSDSES
jgi:hypothetical protein